MAGTTPPSGLPKLGSSESSANSVALLDLDGYHYAESLLQCLCHFAISVPGISAMLGSSQDITSSN